MSTVSSGVEYRANTDQSVVQRECLHSTDSSEYLIDVIYGSENKIINHFGFINQLPLFPLRHLFPMPHCISILLPLDFTGSYERLLKS